ncbi:MAG: hypothetical protein E2590_13115 [Chryseobacterium sp.]|nr:hypothetical protein [Chryseobacterium sp.]
MNIYKNFSEEELVDAYIQWIDNSGKISKELEGVLIERENLAEIIAKANHKKLVTKEKGRIAYEINKLVDKGIFFEDIQPMISSDILNEEELFNFILEKYVIFKSNYDNEKIDKQTLYKSFFGLIIGTFAGISFLQLIVTFLHALHFFFLIPTYVICYLVIRKITGKTRDNLVVFISTFLATTFSAFLVFLVFKFSITD